MSDHRRSLKARPWGSVSASGTYVPKTGTHAMSRTAYIHAEYKQNREMECKYNAFCSHLEYDGIQLYSTLLGATWHIALPLDSKRKRHTAKVFGDICWCR